MYYKNAATVLARDIRLASHPAALAIMAGGFLPKGSPWNIIVGGALWLVMQGCAFFLQAWADDMPDHPP